MTIDGAAFEIGETVIQRLGKAVAIDDETEGYKTFSVAKGYDKRVYVQVAVDLIEDSFDDLRPVVELVFDHLSRQLGQELSHG